MSMHVLTRIEVFCMAKIRHLVFISFHFNFLQGWRWKKTPNQFHSVCSRNRNKQERAVFRAVTIPNRSTFSFSHTLIFIIFFIKILSGFSLVKYQWEPGHGIHHWHTDDTEEDRWLSIPSTSILNKEVLPLCTSIYIFFICLSSPRHQQVPLVFPQTFPRLITAQGVCNETKQEFKMWSLINREAVVVTRAR